MTVWSFFATIYNLSCIFSNKTIKSIKTKSYDVYSKKKYIILKTREIKYLRCCCGAVEWKVCQWTWATEWTNRRSTMSIISESHDGRVKRYFFYLINICNTILFLVSTKIRRNCAGKSRFGVLFRSVGIISTIIE